MTENCWNLGTIAGLCLKREKVKVGRSRAITPEQNNHTDLRKSSLVGPGEQPKEACYLSTVPCYSTDPQLCRQLMTRLLDRAFQFPQNRHLWCPT